MQKKEELAHLIAIRKHTNFEPAARLQDGNLPNSKPEVEGVTNSEERSLQQLERVELSIIEVGSCKQCMLCA